MRADRLTPLLAALALCGSTIARGQTAGDVETLLARVGERIEEYYQRAQSVICIEKSTVQPIGWNYAPQGFARTVESELHVESAGGESGEATIVREVRKVNGRPPRERDRKDRSTCTDPNPLSPEPLAFLLPAHRGEYRFTPGGVGKERNRAAVLLDFASTNTKSRLQLTDDPKGREDCFHTDGELATRGRVWLDAETYDVLRVDERLNGPTDVRVADTLQRRHNFSSWVVFERYDTTIRYRTVDFTDPDERLVLPESIDMLIVLHGGLESTRRSQTFSDYRRFRTGGRIVR
jgi:hypothetical protein